MARRQNDEASCEGRDVCIFRAGDRLWDAAASVRTKRGICNNVLGHDCAVHEPSEEPLV